MLNEEEDTCGNEIAETMALTLIPLYLTLHFRKLKCPPRRPIKRSLCTQHSLLKSSLHTQKKRSLQQKKKGLYTVFSTL
jgi:hypothetical protein